jgi:hypothetical protein
VFAIRSVPSIEARIILMASFAQHRRCYCLFSVKLIGHPAGLWYTSGHMMAENIDGTSSLLPLLPWQAKGTVLQLSAYRIGSAG